MFCSIHDILKRGILPQFQQLSEAALDFDKIIVSCVHVVEPASYKDITQVVDFVRPNTMVLTTLSGCTEEEQCISFFRQLISSRVSAIVIAPIDDSFALPEGALACVSEHCIPVFRIPKSYSFAPIQEKAYSLIRKKDVEIFFELRDQIYNIFLSSQPLTRATGLLAEGLGVPVAISNEIGEIISTSWDEEVKETNLHEPLIFEIGLQSNLYGHLHIYDGGKLDCKDIEEVVHDILSAPLSLLLNDLSIEKSTIARLRNKFVLDLAHGNSEGILSRAMSLKFDLNCPYTCVSMQISAKGEISENTLNTEVAIHSTDIVEILLQFGATHKLKTMVGNTDCFFIIYFEHRQDMGIEALKKLVREIDTAIKQRFLHFDLHWGISEKSSTYEDLPELYSHALLAMKLSVNSINKPRILYYLNTHSSEIICTLTQNSQTLELAEKGLEKLLLYCEHSDNYLIDTLKTYISTNYNSTRTAEILHLHRQSLLYRLKVIESLVGMSLKDHESLFLLEVYLKILGFWSSTL